MNLSSCGVGEKRGFWLSKGRIDLEGPRYNALFEEYNIQNRGLKVICTGLFFGKGLEKIEDRGEQKEFGQKQPISQVSRFSPADPTLKASPYNQNLGNQPPLASIPI